MGERIMDSGEHLHLTPPHQLHTEVDDPLVVHQQIVSDVRDATCQGLANEYTSRVQCG
jgi:hypothetical protein